MSHPQSLTKSTAVLLAVLLTAAHGFGFALLGPYAPWMTTALGYHQAYDIGGPVAIDEEYRWNVPVLTYGFDQSFVDYFGTNGVAAVEGAIAILNSLPPASQLNLTNYPLNAWRVNFQAQSLLNGYDLKSTALHLLVEQLGLAQPERFTFALRQLDPVFVTHPDEANWPTGTIPNLVLERNFDPQTRLPSHAINGSQFYGYVISDPVSNSPPSRELVLALLANPLDPQYTTVADNQPYNGFYYNELSQDDAGGLAYLLNTNNVNYEMVTVGVRGAGTNALAWVNGAWRPGVDKLTFVPHLRVVSNGPFLTMTNQFNDAYVTNGVLRHQQLERVISQPDILFSVGDTGETPEQPLVLVGRTGTTNWISAAAQNGDPSKTGPGIIQPPVKLTFARLGPQLYFGGVFGSQSSSIGDGTLSWASYDGSTNIPIAYPTQRIGTNQTVIRFDLALNRFETNVIGGLTNITSGQSGGIQQEWLLSATASNEFRLEASSNLLNWASLYTITNDGNIWQLSVQNPEGASGYFRIRP